MLTENLDFWDLRYRHQASLDQVFLENHNSKSEYVYKTFQIAGCRFTDFHQMLTYSIYGTVRH